MKVKSAVGCFRGLGLPWGLGGEKCVCLSRERGHSVVDYDCDITYVSSRIGQIKQSGSQLESSGDSKKEVAASC